MSYISTHNYLVCFVLFTKFTKLSLPALFIVDLVLTVGVCALLAVVVA